MRKNLLAGLPIGKTGFTLVELLITISIIGILSTLALSNYQGTRRRARDSKRIVDVRAIQDAFEQYYGIDNIYSATCADMDESLPQGIPTDPLTGENYDGVETTQIDVDSPGCSTDSYLICAQLEIAETGNADCVDGDCNFVSRGDYFCVQSLR